MQGSFPLPGSAPLLGRCADEPLAAQGAAALAAQHFLRGGRPPASLVTQNAGQSGSPRSLAQTAPALPARGPGTAPRTPTHSEDRGTRLARGWASPGLSLPLTPIPRLGRLAGPETARRLRRGPAGHPASGRDAQPGGAHWIAAGGGGGEAGGGARPTPLPGFS